MLLDMLFHFFYCNIYMKIETDLIRPQNNIEDSYYLVCIVHSKKVIPKDDGIDSYLRLISE